MIEDASQLQDPTQPWNRPFATEIQWVHDVISKAAKTDDQKQIAELMPHVFTRPVIRSHVNDLRREFMKRMRDDHIRQQREEISRLEAKRKAMIREHQDAIMKARHGQ